MKRHQIGRFTALLDQSCSLHYNPGDISVSTKRYKCDRDTTHKVTTISTSIFTWQPYHIILAHCTTVCCSNCYKHRQMIVSTWQPLRKYAFGLSVCVVDALLLYTNPCIVDVWHGRSLNWLIIAMNVMHLYIQPGYRHPSFDGNG